MKYRIFQPAADAVFLSRPNRFVITARLLRTGGTVRAHCPNPGRMRELLLPGRRILLERSDTPGRRSPWTLAAVVYRDRTIPLISGRSSDAAGALVLPGMFPGLPARPEQMLGSSRIDWKIGSGRDVSWVEVKSCTLVEHRRAMFPDAPSVRAVRHLEELSATGGRGAVIFTVMNPGAEIFSANPHTDPDFARALKSAADRGVRLRAVTMACEPDGHVRIENEDLEVDLSASDLAEEDSGAVLKIWKRPDGRSVVTVERSADQLGRIVRSRRVPAGAGPEASRTAVFAIRGRLEVFRDLENGISEALGPRVLGAGTETDIAADPGFLSLVLDWRHRRVFARE